MSNKYKKTKMEISSKNIDCVDIIKIIYKNKIVSSVKPNTSIHCNNKLFNRCWIEKGCSVSLYAVKKDEIKTIWEEIKDKTKVKCCYIKTKNRNPPNTGDNGIDFSGCIHNFLD